MIQQIFALLIIIFFASRVWRQKQAKQIGQNEFVFWLIFWLLAAAAIIFIKQIDRFVAYLGFSGAGINFLFYIAVMILFYFLFKMRLKIVKMEKNITDLTREISLKKE